MDTTRIVTMRKQAAESVAFVAIAIVAGLAVRGEPSVVPVAFRPPAGAGSAR